MGTNLPLGKVHLMPLRLRNEMLSNEERLYHDHNPPEDQEVVPRGDSAVAPLRAATVPVVTEVPTQKGMKTNQHQLALLEFVRWM
jgi:hypothetical protein